MRSDPLADALAEFVTIQLAHLHRGTLPGWQVPATFGAHRVGGDVTADLAYTLGLLEAAGVDEVDGTPLDEALDRVLDQVNGESTHTFFSYRVAETLARYGTFDTTNPRLAPFDRSRRDDLARACDSSDWIGLLDAASLPRNYAAVLARCEVAREKLGLIEPGTADELVARVGTLLATNPDGYLDDSEDGTAGRYDIYTVDLYLFCEPLASLLGPIWTTGMRQALLLAETVSSPSGASVGWGRSTGALSLCLTVELAALSATTHLGDDGDRWLARGAAALRALQRGWFDDGIITAHQHRSPYGYRGPKRRLQMTLDCLGKLAWSAAVLSGGVALHLPGADADAGARDPAGPATPAADVHPVDPWAGRNELTRFERDRHAAVWSVRTRRGAALVPFVGAARSDYLAAPMVPGLFEVPVDRPLVTWLPTAWVGDDAWAPIGVPDHLGQGTTDVEPTVHARWDRWGRPARRPDDTETRPGTAALAWRLDGRSLVLDATLHPPPDTEAISMTIPEAAHRPLQIEVVEATPPARLRRVATDGMREWQSFWGSLPVVHELETARPTDGPVRWSVRVTPKLRVASESGHHHYHRSLYDPLAEHIVEQRFASYHLDEPDGGASRLAHTDLFHLHWPEWFLGADVERMRTFLDLLDAERVRLVWTMHNLVPHAPEPGHDEVYALVASRAAAVIHHSASGERRARARWDYAPAAIHRVIPHGHFGNLLADEPGDRPHTEGPTREGPTGRGITDGSMAQDRRARRAAQADELAWPPCGLRLGILGAPREGKDVLGFVRAFAACDRDDLGLVVTSLRPHELDQVPDDPRIIAEPYEFIDRATYNRRLGALDALVLPFTEDTPMLTTGVFADAVGAGIAALCGPWEFLTEMLGDAAIPLGADERAWRAAIDGLSADRVLEAADASVGLQPRFAWATVADETLRLFDEVGTARL